MQTEAGSCAQTWNNSAFLMPGVEGLRMNNARMVQARAEKESIVSTLKDDLDLFTETGGLDRAMCNGVRAKMEVLKRRWEGMTKDFTTLLAAAMESEARELTLSSQDQ